VVRSKARVPAGERLLWLSLTLAASAASGLVAFALGVAAPTPCLILVAAGLALLALTVVLNALLRLQGLGGEGLAGATGVLGAGLVLLSRIFLTMGGGELLGGAQPEPAQAASVEGAALFGSLEFLGWLLTAFWIVHAGSGLRRLLGPAGWLQWGSLAAAGALLVLAFRAMLEGTAPSPGAGGAVTFLPLMIWSAGLAAICAFGQTITMEPSQE
jgi:hypothetical protein